MSVETSGEDGSADGATAVGRAQQQLLVSVHVHLRDELRALREMVDQVASGRADVGALRHLINDLTMRQNYWTLGSFCAAYCRVVAIHHTIEDQTMFPGLENRDASLAPVIARLSEEHEQIAGVLTGLDEALVAMVSDDGGLTQVQVRTAELAERLLAHLDYEEEQLLPAIGRLTDRVI